MNAPLPEPSGWRRWAARLLDVLYPSACALCDAPLRFGQCLCQECHADLPPLRAPFCEVCGECFDGAIDRPFACPNCGELDFAFTFARPAMRHDARTRSLIHRVKYGREVHLAAGLAWLAEEAFADPRLAEALESHWPLVPVPLHWRRRQHRYFNQAREIALHLGRRFGLRVCPALKRNRGTETQTHLTRHQRLANLNGAFQVTAAGRRLVDQEIPGVILIDDVFTTGATVHECARTLKKAGLQKVIVVTVMRG